uniref:Orf41 n=1 Tax=Serratia marcescens TaxID=615 RepID=A0A7S6YKL4_SERMA|nr:Orf41 [Serratia marcescens]
MLISSGENAVGCEECAGVRIATLRIAGVYNALRGGAQPRGTVLFIGKIGAKMR